MPPPNTKKAAPKKRRRKADAPGRRMTVSEVLRQTIEARGSAYAAARAAGVDPSQLTRFLNGERGLSTATFDAVCEALGLELRETRKGRTAAGSRPAEAEAGG